MKKTISVLVIILAFAGFGFAAYKIGEEIGMESIVATTDEQHGALSNKEAEELFKKALDTYWYNGFDISSTEVEISGIGAASEILNFDKVIDAVFSKNGKKQFIETVNSIFENDGKIYKMSADRGSDIYYVSTELIQTSSNDKRIEYIAKSKYIELDENFEDAKDYKGNNFIYREKSFVIVEENGKWLVEEFTQPN